ncbi:MAG: DUF2007 domain-containing protein, partial [Desulfobacterales bacterium]|nr:DUF2007 domain-containing protein [Desulfobacterales bacterium]
MPCPKAPWARSCGACCETNCTSIHAHEGYKMLKIYSARHPTEAHLLKGILASYGILSEVRSEFLFAGRGELPIGPETAPSVWILDAARFDEAAAIAADFDHPLPSAD